jgi:monoamine oxidase
MKKTRREFFELTGKWASGAALYSTLGSSISALSGCATFDRLVLGESRDESDRIVILGAGISGLVAATELKKKGLPFRIYEAQSRVGGRIHSIRDVDANLQHVDLGAEDFSLPADQPLFDLAKENKVLVERETSRARPLWCPDGKTPLSSARWTRGIAQIQKVIRQVEGETFGGVARRLHRQNSAEYPRAIALDKMTAAEFVKRLDSHWPDWTPSYFQALALSTWGTSLENLSALFFVQNLSFTPSLISTQRFRIAGGTGQLTQALYDRLAGVIPDRSFRFNHRLARISRRGEKWRLEFETNSGITYILAKHVLISLPLTVLQKIEGAELLMSSQEDAKLFSEVAYGALSRAVLTYEDRGWRKNQDLQLSPAFLLPHGIFVRLPGTLPQVKSGKVSVQFSAQEAQSLGPHSVSKAQELLAQLGISGSLSAEPFLRNWSKDPSALGAVAYRKPGQVSAWPELWRFKDGAFIGDAFSIRRPGSVVGAIESAVVAARWMMKEAESLYSAPNV